MVLSIRYRYRGVAENLRKPRKFRSIVVRRARSCRGKACLALSIKTFVAFVRFVVKIILSSLLEAPSPSLRTERVLFFRLLGPSRCALLLPRQRVDLMFPVVAGENKLGPLAVGRHQVAEHL